MFVAPCNPCATNGFGRRGGRGPEVGLSAQLLSETPLTGTMLGYRVHRLSIGIRPSGVAGGRWGAKRAKPDRELG